MRLIPWTLRSGSEHQPPIEAKNPPNADASGFHIGLNLTKICTITLTEFCSILISSNIVIMIPTYETLANDSILHVLFHQHSVRNPVDSPSRPNCLF
jgi:hypothetical protein